MFYFSNAIRTCYNLLYMYTCIVSLDVVRKLSWYRSWKHASRDRRRFETVFSQKCGQNKQKDSDTKTQPTRYREKQTEFLKLSSLMSQIPGYMGPSIGWRNEMERKFLAKPLHSRKINLLAYGIPDDRPRRGPSLCQVVQRSLREGGSR